MVERLMYPDFGAKKTEYAGQEAKYENGTKMLTKDGDEVKILDYKKELGVYVVMRFDKPGTISPPYRVHPDELVPIEPTKTEEK
ncbi:MAG TPA: hypothetical protein PKH95_00655 [Candidatus Magasanikbacteria bacterium]|nr:hypothetical protein [Candidatus Magasanikbacteria bacterium]